MMLEYEWSNPAAAAAAAMLLFGDGGHEAAVAGGERGPSIFDHYGGGHGVGDFFAPPALFSTTTAAPATAACGQRYGLGLPPAPAAARIGLNLGGRTYFSSASPEEEMAMGRVCRRRTRTARCQAEGCGADLTHAKHYHRRHKVCEFHSKASIVIAAGLSQRFCQQCSRFHVLAEFDQGKRSCRKRLADHNRRRRKSQDLTTINTNGNTSGNTIAVINKSNGSEKSETVILDASSSNNSRNNNNNNNENKNYNNLNSLEVNPDSGSSVTGVSSPAASAVGMALGLGCSGGGGIVASPTGTGLSGSSSTVTSPTRVPFLAQFGEFRGHEYRFLSWEDGEDGGSIRSLYPSK
ncbi:hypothetical protein HPP92_022320 [Vanilla planifolia]|uniref:SBP-type domain-containing protein n=1 Tax=Vanilla planifolia TaxID=51239 RepID=A0A835UDF4_VANPL|nr:hypothetical protein HPP92_022320 [Vanilla planifolia]